MKNSIVPNSPRPTDRSTSNKKKIFYDWVSKSTMHGFPKLVEKTSAVQKIIWIVVVLASLSSCSYYCTNNVLEFLKYPVITNVNTVFFANPEFPAVTVCGFNTNNYKCRFDGKVCLSEYLTVKNSSCYVFNSGFNSSTYPMHVLTSKEAGYINGLNLELYHEDNSEIVLFIHNHSCNIDPKKEIRVNKNLETSLILNRIHEKKLPAPYSDCKKDYSFEKKPNDIVNSSPYPYFQSECNILCSIKKEMENCGKNEEFQENMSYYFTNKKYFYEIFYYPLINSCTKSNESSINQVKSFLEEKGQNQVCHDMCPIECDATTYEMTTYTQWTGKDYAIVNIYYEELSYVSITEFPKTTSENLWGNIGGLLGLFLGTSLLTFVEVIDLIFGYAQIKSKENDLNSDLPVMNRADEALGKPHENLPRMENMTGENIQKLSRIENMTENNIENYIVFANKFP